MRWEYKAVNLTGKKIGYIDFTTTLNELGIMGWRLVFCHFDENVFIFERLAPDV